MKVFLDDLKIGKVTPIFQSERKDDQNNYRPITVLKSYLSDKTQCCSRNGVRSKFRSVLCGVPQESIPGPLLFIVYMNDLLNSV